MNTDQPRVKTTKTSFRIIERIRETPGAGVSELARGLDLSKGAVHKHVHTLTELGYLVREENGYYLSIRFLGLGVRARDRLPLDTARKVVEDLAETTGHTTSFVLHENHQGVYVFRVTPPDAESGFIVEGDVAPLHATAGGKAILALFSTEQRAEIIDTVGLSRYTDKTITDPQELKHELRSIRDQRVAFDREELETGLQCVAAPVVAESQTPVAAVSVSGDIHHLSGTRLEVDITGLVTSAAKSIEKELISR